jgi:hypothetical protein
MKLTKVLQEMLRATRKPHPQANRRATNSLIIILKLRAGDLSIISSSISNPTSIDLSSNCFVY